MRKCMGENKEISNAACDESRKSEYALGKGWCAGCDFKESAYNVPESQTEQKKDPGKPKILKKEPKVCTECHREGKKIAGRGLCGRCYARVRTAEAKAEMEESPTCKKCNTTAAINKKGYCPRCWASILHEQKPPERIKTGIDCLLCGEKNIQTSCEEHDRTCPGRRTAAAQEDPDEPRRGRCLLCGEYKVVYLDGLCQHCYDSNQKKQKQESLAFPESEAKALVSVILPIGSEKDMRIIRHLEMEAGEQRRDLGSHIWYIIDRYMKDDMP